MFYYNEIQNRRCYICGKYLKEYTTIKNGFNNNFVCLECNKMLKESKTNIIKVNRPAPKLFDLWL